MWRRDVLTRAATAVLSLGGVGGRSGLLEEWEDREMLRLHSSLSHSMRTEKWDEAIFRGIKLALYIATRGGNGDERRDGNGR